MSPPLLKPFLIIGVKEMNDEKLKRIFSDILVLPVEKITDELRYNEAPAWDSVAHMALIAAIEQSYDILLETEDIIDMSSFAKAKEIIARSEAN